MMRLKKLNLKEREGRAKYISRIRRVVAATPSQMDAKERMKQVNAQVGVERKPLLPSRFDESVRIWTRDIIERIVLKPHGKTSLLNILLNEKDQKTKEAVLHTLEEYLFINIFRRNVNEVLVAMALENMVEGRKSNLKGMSRIAKMPNPVYDYNTPYHAAMEVGDEEISKALYEFGADPLATNAEALIGVNLALMEGHEKLVERFVEEGY